jgi:glycosyltransferase involved in cell wall biosynthesis
LLGRIAGKIAGVPIIISTVHITELRRRHHLWLDRFTSRLVDTEICICDAVREFTLKEARISPDKLVSIPNGINLEKFDRQWNREGKRAEFGISSQTKVIGTVSRLSKQKGLEFLLRAVPGILRNVPNSAFIIVGDGELKPQLMQLAKKLGIKDKVIFAGFRKDALEVMNIFDVFVLPSLWEGLPIALLEAMALSKPIVATAVGGCRELVTDGENGFLVEPSEASELSEAITTILTDSELASRMEQNSRKRAEQYTVDKMVEKTENLYEELLEVRH